MVIRKKSFGCGAVLLLMLVGGCGESSVPPITPASSAIAPASGVRPAGTPVAVTTVKAKQRDFDLLIDAVGTVSSLASVDIKSQVSSLVTRVHVHEGQFVRSGDVLFTLDARNDQSNLEKAKAQLAKDTALLADSKRQLARTRELVSQGFVSQGALDSIQSQVDAQQATVLADSAAVDAAHVALGYATVRAARGGRLGAINVFPGTAVIANQTTLVTLTQMDPVNVSFNLPQRNLQAALAALKNGGMGVVARSTDAGFEVRGHLSFVDSVVDGATGTVKVKARFDNRDGRLWPGAFVNIRMVADTLNNAIVVPTPAVVQSAKGPILYIVENGKASLRPVKVLASHNGETAITGLLGNESVVLDGRQNLRPDAAVLERSPVSTEPKSTTKPASAP